MTIPITGSLNGFIYGTNADFTQSAIPSINNGLITDNQIWCGATALNAGGTHINVRTLNTPNAGETVKFAQSGTNLNLNTSDALGNTIIGLTAGNSSNTSPYNTVLGVLAGNYLVSGEGGNTLIGWSCGTAITTGNNNTAQGQDSLAKLTTGIQNLAFGNSTLNNITSGSYNTVFGQGAATGLTGADSSNVIIGSAPISPGTNNAIIIGHQGSGNNEQNTCIIAGIVGVTVSNAEYVTINSSTGQLGIATIPSTFQSINVQTFIYTGSSQTYTPTSGMLYCTIEVVGGGGGGGGSSSSGGSNSSVGGAGGAGGYSRKTVAASIIAASQTVKIGAGGSGGGAGNNNGVTGGTTSVGAIVSATGGVFGTGSSANTHATSPGGIGGVGSSGDFNCNGGAGDPSFTVLVAGVVQLCQSGNGGNSIFGGGGLGVSNGGTSADGNAGTNYGSGGCGAISASSDGGAASVGGDGAPGIVIITEYI